MPWQLFEPIRGPRPAQSTYGRAQTVTRVPRIAAKKLAHGHAKCCGIYIPGVWLTASQNGADGMADGMVLLTKPASSLEKRVEPNLLLVLLKGLKIEALRRHLGRKIRSLCVCLW